METFRFRLNCIDYYQATPTEIDPVLRRKRGPNSRLAAPQVPVIRAFGATETGQKVCAHIHGALPYLYLEYTGSLENHVVDAYKITLRASIDQALAATYRRNAHDGKSAYVGHITLVKGVPFFGYNVGYKVFLKIYMLNPIHMTRFADLLHQGAILNRVFQPYEAHLQYILQWMCDYNLYGCNYLDCLKVQFRRPVPDSEDTNTKLHKWHDASIPENLIAGDDQYPRQSHCTLEVDICVQDILNRHELQYRPIHHDFLERSSQVPKKLEEKYVPSLASLWKDETRRRKFRLGLTDPSSSPFPPEVLVSMTADPGSNQTGGWVHEEEYRELVEGLIEEEKRQHNESLRFDTFVKQAEGLEHIKTAVESIEDLYPENLASQIVPDGILVQDSGLQEKRDALLDGVLSGIVESHGKTVIEDEESQNGDDSKENAGSDLGESQSLDPLTASLLEDSREDATSVDPDGEAIHLHDMDGNRSVFRTGTLGISQKRRHDPLPEECNKRQRILAETQRSVKRISFRNALGNQDKKAFQGCTGSTQNTPPHLGQVSEGSMKSQDHRDFTNLPYSAVKNANLPEKMLDLNQSERSHSQDDPKTPVPRNHTFRTSQQIPTSPWTHQMTSPMISASSTPNAQSDATVLARRLGIFSKHRGLSVYFGNLPPSYTLVSSTMMHVGLLPIIYPDAYYSNEDDVPDRAREYAGREFKLQSTTLPYLPPFDLSGKSAANAGDYPPVIVEKSKLATDYRLRSHRCSLRHWEIARLPPSFQEVDAWISKDSQRVSANSRQKNMDEREPRPTLKFEYSTNLSQIDGPTQRNKHGFKFSQMKQSSSVKYETQYMSIMSLEMHVNSRGSLVPDPAKDEIQCIFWSIQGEENATTTGPRVGILCFSTEHGIVDRIAKQVPIKVEYEEDELDLINRLVDIVRQFDPDVLTGYEVHNGSWGYLIERARMKYDYNLCDEISRIKTHSQTSFDKDNDRWGFTHTSTIRITGRHMINIWRAMRGELNLLQYTMENVVFHLLHKRIPHYQHSDLTSWYCSAKPRDLARVLTYFISRVQLNLDILEANEIIPRTSEQARILGVDFFSVISRGSQFKVESTMFRIAKPENFILVSPSRKQVGQQNALECLPLVMEPQSAFYSSPLIVLDFQSLYPSVMIAYNICYSTCLGRITSWRGRNKLGFMDFQREPGLLELVRDHINIAPNGMMYVKPEMRKSLLAKMLGELLETRVMVKSGMKQDKDDKALQQLLNNRQLALKLLANVTYGYTSASFSGRMPCSEIADSIVQTGRETLEKAIAIIHANTMWGAEVVYGDTDSLFIHLKGRTRDQAFTIGEEISAAISAANPQPIKLKFEKVYHPCVLLAKKRYVGFKYEDRNQKEPEFDAKGIETVRRDGTPAEQKIEERALKILFRTSDLSQVKRYFQEQCYKIMNGRVSIQDFLFAKEVKLGTYSDKGPPPPGALIATKRMLSDPRTEPQYGERIPYVVITGAPGARLSDRCVSPETLLQNDHLELDAEYYISKNLIPPLERIFNLVGANVRQWFDEMPRVQRIRSITLPSVLTKPAAAAPAPLKKTLESYMKSSACLVCRAELGLRGGPQIPSGLDAQGTFAMLPLCSKCLVRPARSLLALRTRLCRTEVRVKDVDSVCRSCSGLPWGEEIRCDSRDCPVFYTRIRERSRLKTLKDNVGSVIDALERGEEGLDW